LVHLFSLGNTLLTAQTGLAFRFFKIKEIKNSDGVLQKIVIVDGLTSIKIEPNFTLRGTLLPVVKMDLHKAVEDRFLYSVKNIPVLSRNTKGVILMRFKTSDDKVNAITIMESIPSLPSTI
jgi:hypothetical protein